MKIYKLLIKLIYKLYCGLCTIRWRLVYVVDAPRTLCGGQTFGLGENGVVFEKSNGKITCPDCKKNKT